MKIQALNCPHCGGKINYDVEQGAKSIFCTYCGQSVYLDDEVRRTENTEVSIDQTRIKESDNETRIKLEQIKLYELELNKYYKSRRIKYIALAIIVGILIVATIITAIMSQSANDATPYALGVSAFVVLGWGMIFIHQFDRKPEMPDFDYEDEEEEEEDSEKE